MSRYMAALAGLSMTKKPYERNIKRLKELCKQYEELYLHLQAVEDVKLREKIAKVNNKIYQIFGESNGDHNGVFITSLIEIGKLDFVLEGIDAPDNP